MSDNIPFEIQSEIIHRVPDTKSLIRFRSVSKAWKSVIDNPEFVTAHYLRHHRAHNHLLIRKLDYGSTEVKYVSIVDDDVTFPNQKHNVFVPDLVRKYYHYSNIVGSSHGLFCLYDGGRSNAVIWNPFIRKTVSVKIPKEDDCPVVGFGVCPRNLDPKLVKITYVSENFSTLVEVFTLISGGTWRNPLSSNLPHNSIKFGYSGVAIDGFIYWVASVHDGFGYHNLIMSFDLTSEEFTKVNLPVSLALKPIPHSTISILRESFAIFEFDLYNVRRSCNVWMMIGHGSTRSFSKLYSIDNSLLHPILGFRKNGAPIIEVRTYNERFFDRGPVELAIYEPESESNTNIGINGRCRFFIAHSYTETLLLLGH